MANNTNWLNISSQSGSSGQTILTLSANKNLSTNYKTAEITAYNPVYNISAKTYVTLEAYSPILSISPGLFGVPDSGGTYELTISANCAWVIAFPDLVTSYSTSAGSGNAVVTFTVPGTTADTTLTGNIVVTDESGQISRIAKVEQYGSGVHIGIFPVELYFDSTGGSKTFSVTADAAYNVSVGSGTDWAFVEPHSGYTGQTTFTVTVNSENTGTTDKQGVINIDAPGQDLAVILYQRKPETRVVATYYVTSTTDPTSILRSTASFSAAEYPDGTQITLGTGYTFPTTGYQTVYYTLTGDTVGNNTFFGTPITSVVIPKGVTSLGLACFANSSGLTSITLPNTLISIGNACFAGDLSGSSLSAITLPDSLTSIGWQAFRGCTSLSSITIPSAVTSIGSNCFSGSSVSSITFTSLTPPTLGATNALTSNTLSEIIVPCPAVNDYITAWPQYAQYISCQDTGTTLYFTTDTSNVKGIGETRTITILNTNINPNRTGLNLPSDFPQQGSYTVVGNTIYITYPRNPSSSATRSWTIGVVAQTNDGVSLSGSYSITQNANVTYSIPYTADTSTVDASGETRTITIDTSNLVASSITIGVEGATGVTYTYENGVITVVFPRNNTSGERDIVVTVTGQTVGGTDAIASISYRQDSDEIYLIPYTADTSTVDASGETRYIYIDTSNLVQSSITISSSGIPGIITSYDSATGIVTVIFPDNTGSGYELLEATITIEGETINGHYAVAVVEYEQAGTDISGIPLTFVIKTDGYIRWGQTNTVTTTPKTISYSKNGGNWVSITSSVVPSDCPRINVVAGDILRFKGDNETYGSGSYGNAHFQDSTAEYNVYGNIMSMMYGDNFSGQTALTGTFGEFFSGEKIHSAKSLILPATSLNGGIYGAYSKMFMNCRMLTQTPSLPATKVRGSDYDHMFAGCGGLTQAPRLPQSMDIGIYNLDYGVNHNSSRFSYMFENCTGITKVPYDYLPSLIQGVETGSMLPAGCFEGMFKGCTNLVKVPDLPYPVLGDYCYKAMFEGCSNLVMPPTLPATTFIKYDSTIANGCYESMFKDCISLTTAPALPITEVGDYSYASMFSGCTSLTQAPELPATILGDRCYRWMFGGCTGLTDAPVLPAETIKMRSYDLMFYHCTNISAITCLATNVTNVEDEEGYIMQWVTGVAPAGKFIKKWNVNWPIGDNGIPSGWVVKDYLPTNSEQYFQQSGGTYVLNFTALSNWTATPSDSWISVSQASGGSGDITLAITVSASQSGRTGSVTITDSLGVTVITINQNYYLLQPLTFKIVSGGTIVWKVYVNYGGQTRGIEYKKNDGDWTGITSSTAGTSFSVATGDIVQFRGSNTSYADFSSYEFYTTFKDSTAQFNAEGNIMSLLRKTGFESATTLNKDYAFMRLFYECNGLISAENLLLPATTLKQSCYLEMFSGCTNMTAAPALLPATVMAGGCYASMFKDCTSLTQAPEIPIVTQVADSCWSAMFFGCTNLGYIKCLTTTYYAGSFPCTSNWVTNVASTGTFVKNPETSWTTGTSGIPSGWTRVNYTS